MDYLDCDDEVVFGLIDLLTAGLAGYHPKLGPNIEDLESLYQSLCVLKPNHAELETFDGIIKMKRGLIEEAIVSFRHVLEKRDFIHAKAMLAYCLFLQEDVLWHGLADEVLAQGPAEDILEMMQTIKKYESFKKGDLSEQSFVDSLGLNKDMHNELPDHVRGNPAQPAAQAFSTSHSVSKNITELTPSKGQAGSTPSVPDHALRL